MVSFVGAGCGAADLITVRGMRLLQEADLVIYAGSLVNPELLSYTKEGCVCLNSAYMTLDEVIDALQNGEKEGKKMVRLHTGDPSIYGAIREQMDRLEELGIEYETCPGVTAAFGAAAAMDLELTIPEVSQSLIITRMAGKTSVPEKESIESFAAHQATMAIYLSAGHLKELSKRLMAGGYKEDTPAAIVYKATWPEQLCVKCTVKTLAEAAEAYGIKKTAVVLVGDAISPSAYALSRLYAPDFETEYRKKKTTQNIETEQIETKIKQTEKEIEQTETKIEQTKIKQLKEVQQMSKTVSHKKEAPDGAN